MGFIVPTVVDEGVVNQLSSDRLHTYVHFEYDYNIVDSDVKNAGACH